MATKCRSVLSIAPLLLALGLAGCSEPMVPGPSEEVSVPTPSVPGEPAGPDAQPSVFKGTRAEQAHAVADCMIDKGWDVEMNDDG